MKLITSVALWLVLASQIVHAQGPLAPDAAAASIQLPDGFKATLFAGEPDIVQPMSIAFDDRGRLWAVECRSYPKWQPVGVTEGSDRILIFEDTDGDGRFDTRKVFLDKGVNFSSVEYGFGGVFITSIPSLLFVPDANKDDVPDGPPQVLIDGFDTKAIHNVANSLTWGPDGWLYGCNGILSNSRIGKPGTPDAERIPMNCGIWRYHPVKHDFEVVCHGTTNPWGVAFDERGEAFLTNCVIEHAFHVVPGARFKRMFGQDFNPRTFELMQTCADHIHWAGGTWEGSRDGGGKHGEAGGGHAHSGAMVYLGTQFPADFRNCLFTLNIHGKRLNRDKLERQGSGYVAKHLADFAPSGDPWFRGVCVKQGLDGAVYTTDWSDTGECHNYDDATIHRGNGRIFKIGYGKSSAKPVDYSKLSDQQLIDVLTDKDGLRANVARRILQERAANGTLDKLTRQYLLDAYGMRANAPIDESWSALRYLWALHSTGTLPDFQLSTTEPNLPADDTLRGWVVRLTLESQPSPGTLKSLAGLAASDRSSYVRLQLASGLQRLPVANRLEIGKALASHAEDANDNNLTLMVWYGIEPLVAANDDVVLPLALSTKIPKLRQFIARHMATGDSPRFSALLRWLEERNDDSGSIRDVLTGLHAGIEGRHNVQPNNEWTTLAARLAMNSDPTIRELTQRISLIQGQQSAFHYFSQVLKDSSQDVARRERALADLVATRRPEVAELLLHALSEPTLRDSAIRGLAGFDRKENGPKILALYSSLPDNEKSDAIATLVSRESTALDLMQAVDAEKLPKQDLSEFDIRQLQRFKAPQLNVLVKKHFAATPSSAERAAQIAEMKRQVLAGDPQSASAGRGRTLFQKNCTSCHTLFGEGRQVGPDLTGAQRTDLDYVLINVMDPSALVGHAYRVTVIELKDGRVINGIVKAEDAQTITLQTATDRIVVATQDIESRQQQPVSMMPDGLLNRLTISEVRDLVKYLGSPDQVAAQ